MLKYGEEKDVSALMDLLDEAEKDPKVIEVLKVEPDRYRKFQKLVRMVENYRPPKQAADAKVEEGVKIDPDYEKLRALVQKLMNNQGTPAALKGVLRRMETELKKTPRPVAPGAEPPAGKAAPKPKKMVLQDSMGNPIKSPKPGAKPRKPRPLTKKQIEEAPTIEELGGKPPAPEAKPGEDTEPLSKHFKRNPKYRAIYWHLPDEMTDILDSLGQGFGSNQPQSERMPEKKDKFDFRAASVRVAGMWLLARGRI